MSTRSSITYGENFHLYHDLVDSDNAVYLRLSGKDLCFDASPGEVTLKIPAYLWEHLRMFPAVSSHVFQIMSDEEIQQLVEREVDARIEEYALDSSPWTAFFGSAVFGSATLPRDEQIELGVKHYQEERSISQTFLANFDELNQKLSKWQLDNLEAAAENVLKVVQSLRVKGAD